MPAVALQRRLDGNGTTHQNPLPELLHTPAGLAILEIQGTVHAPLPDNANGSTEAGRLEFPLYEGNDKDLKEGPWMKKVHLYIGKHQRLTGEVKKLPKPLVIIAKPGDGALTNGEGTAQFGERLDIVAVIKYKLLFSSRPEPVGL